MKPEYMIEVIQAYIDGKTIQYMQYSAGKWRDIKDQPMFNFSQNYYRVKPVPRTFYLYRTIETAPGYYEACSPDKQDEQGYIRTIKVLEVIE